MESRDSSNELKKDPVFRIAMYIFCMIMILVFAVALFTAHTNKNGSMKGLLIAMLCLMMVAFIGIMIVIVIMASKYKNVDENENNYLKAYTCKHASFNGLKGSEGLVGSFSNDNKSRFEKRVGLIANILQIVDSVTITVLFVLLLYINRDKLSNFNLENMEFIVRSVGLLIILVISIIAPFAVKRKSSEPGETVINYLYSCIGNQDDFNVHDKRIFNKRLFCEFEYNDVTSFAMVSERAIHMYIFEDKKIEELKELLSVSKSVGSDAMNSRIYKFFSGTKEHLKMIEHSSENYIIEEMKRLIDNYKKNDKKEIKGSYFSSMMEQRNNQGR